MSEPNNNGQGAGGENGAGNNPNPNPSQKPAAAEKLAKKTKARALVDFDLGGKPVKANDVLSLTERELKAYAGNVDASPEAVKYAESLGNGDGAEEALEA